MRELPNADEQKHVVKLLQLGSRMLIFVEIELLHFSELQNGSKVINLQHFATINLREHHGGPSALGVASSMVLEPCLLAPTGRMQSASNRRPLRRPRKSSAPLLHSCESARKNWQRLRRRQRSNWGHHPVGPFFY